MIQANNFYEMVHEKLPMTHEREMAFIFTSKLFSECVFSIQKVNITI
jgi:hypothetical protein